MANNLGQSVFARCFDGLLTEVDWYIIPVLNPDGYEYSHTTDRYYVQGVH